MAQQPTIGRIVLYRLSEQDAADIFTAHGTTNGSFEEGVVLPAIIIRIQDKADGCEILYVDLAVQLGGATMLRRAVCLSDTGRADDTGFWFWPPRS
jgi:hypothetical protein